jgi:hypothetical protein
MQNEEKPKTTFIQPVASVSSFSISRKTFAYLLNSFIQSSPLNFRSMKLFVSLALGGKKILNPDSDLFKFIGNQSDLSLRLEQIRAAAKHTNRKSRTPYLRCGNTTTKAAEARLILNLF